MNRKTIKKLSVDTESKVRSFRVLTPEETSADIKKFGRKICKTEESAISFLQAAGILDENGELADHYR
jgi:hypothetical protein